MRAFAFAAMAATLGIISAIVVGDTGPAATHRYHQGRYYNYNGGRWCPPEWTIQGGMCKPHRRSMWDW
jgi:hypothetical protein